MNRLEWHWIERFGTQLEHCDVRPGETAVVLWKQHLGPSWSRRPVSPWPGPARAAGRGGVAHPGRPRAGARALDGGVAGSRRAPVGRGVIGQRRISCSTAPWKACCTPPSWGRSWPVGPGC